MAVWCYAGMVVIPEVGIPKAKKKMPARKLILTGILYLSKGIKRDSNAQAIKRIDMKESPVAATQNKAAAAITTVRLLPIFRL
jgi:hypothetical protein